MGSPVDPPERTVRDPRDIAADILDYPLDKPATEVFDRQKHVGDREQTFRYYWKKSLEVRHLLLLQ